MPGSGPLPPTARALPSKSAIRPGPYRSMEGEAIRAQVAVLELQCICMQCHVM